MEKLSSISTSEAEKYGQTNPQAKTAKIEKKQEASVITSLDVLSDSHVTVHRKKRGADVCCDDERHENHADGVGYGSIKGVKHLGVQKPMMRLVRLLVDFW